MSTAFFSLGLFSKGNKIYVYSLELALFPIEYYRTIYTYYGGGGGGGGVLGSSFSNSRTCFLPQRKLA